MDFGSLLGYGWIMYYSRNKLEMASQLMILKQNDQKIAFQKLMSPGSYISYRDIYCIKFDLLFC